ncbi:SRPBCC family protein [Qipengyuania soli]|uniref:SRPBCC family protein n=1 Tax=Qipengyuania soli TaxID=2782568 RepID=A0A7S8F291_9SPHN|nr:SRPBCC family protein [Qipengyuania soli]QPC97794.1 SRPBCC family protein [Qipengyuania soli]
MHRFATAIALFSAAPVAAEVVETRADGFVTRDTVTVATTSMKTWLALTKPGDWWTDAHTWSGDASNMTLVPQAGGCFCEKVPGEDRKDGFSLDGSVQHMTVIQSYPLKVLRMRGGLGPLQGEPATGVLTITLKGVEGGTRVLWEYNVGGPMRYKIDEISKAVDGVMTQQLRALRDHLGPLDTAEDRETAATENPSPDSLEAEIDSLGQD